MEGSGDQLLSDLDDDTAAVPDLDAQVIGVIYRPQDHRTVLRDPPPNL